MIVIVDQFYIHYQTSSMKAFQKIVLSDGHDSQELGAYESAFLFPYLIRFCCKQDLDFVREKEINLENELLNEFRDIVTESLNHLINDCYKEPTLKARQKHPTRFEKIFLFENKYIIDYRTSIAGKLIYSVYSIFQFVNRLIDTNGILNISTIDDQ